MNDLAQAVAFFESLNLAHGDPRPENILLDRNRLKLSDFDCTAKIGTKYEACMAPYGRILNSNEADQGEDGTFGFLGPRTEQFAIGSIYHHINYGFEVYGDRCLTEDPYDHGPKVVDLLRDMEFPKLDGNPLINDIIDKYWHNKYVKVADLAAHTKNLLHESPDRSGESRSDENELQASNSVRTPMEITIIFSWLMIMGRIFHGLLCAIRNWWTFAVQNTHRDVETAERADGESSNPVDENLPLGEDFISKRNSART
jgi:hypothetical protein